jgi:hypothetical protein
MVMGLIVMSDTCSDCDSLVMKTIMKDGSARMTVSIDDADHMFTVQLSERDDEVMIEHEESQLYRGCITTGRPCDEVYSVLTDSREFQEYIQGFH